MPSQSEPPRVDAAPLSHIPGAWDCHVHVFGPHDGYPLSPDRRYMPGEATAEDAWAHAAAIGVERLVVVQPSPYGEDNRCMLNALAALGPGCRGVVVLRAAVLNDATLADLSATGVRGVRLNPNGRIRDVDEVRDELRALVARLRGTCWHVELHCPAELAGPLARIASPREVPLVFDHLVGLDPGAPDFSTRLDEAARVVTDEPIWVKVSGTTRSPDLPHIRAKQAEAIARLHDCGADRLVWGSDWPHTPLAEGESGLRKVDEAREIRLTLSAFGSEAEHLFRRNPERLFG